MDEFNKLIHNIDDMTEWDPLLFKNVTDQLNSIYKQDIEQSNLQWNLSSLGYPNSECGLDQNYFQQITQESINKSNQDEQNEDSTEKLESILDKAETYLYGLVNGFKKLSNKIR